MTTHALQTNMADACEESSSDCSDSISGDNSSFYTKSGSPEENLRYEEPRTSSSPVEKLKSRREESISSSKRSAKKKSAKQKKASFQHSRRRSPGGTDFVDIFKTES